MTRREAPHPLRRRALFLLWIASFCTEVTRWALLIALPLYALSITRSALITSTVAMLGLLPSLLLTPLAGILADKWNRSRFMACLTISRALLLLPLLLVHDSRQLWIVYLVVATEAGLTAMFESVKNAMVPSVVEADQLITANASISLSSNLGRLAGSPLGGFVLAWTGIPGIVAAAVTPLIITVLLVLALPRARANAVTQPAFWRGASAGLQLIRHTPALRAVAVVLGLLALAQGMFVILFLLFVTDLLGGGEPEAGLLRGVQAVGGLLGGALTAHLARKLDMRRLMTYSLLTFGLLSLVIWNSASITTAMWFYAGFFTLSGAPSVWIMAAWLSAAQQATPHEFQGRVMSALFALSDGLQAAGLMLAGALASLLPTLALLNGQALLFFLAAALFWRMLATPTSLRRERSTHPINAE
ncbi:MFS transporter [Acrocarpospora macrocephala]|uniref:MFS transporter n=1 Tax=Acrocarpospora macrocephala TaxID=150177 RepID=A0A5M3WQ26_9ACTN|nr:MFS transporter [Acrocarpospora macrocephala]GES11447.1 MFS transporter [Acrocarpospora macrocephala]